MVAALVLAALAWLHVFCAIVWMGSLALFEMVIGPLIPRLSAATRAELITKLMPRMTRFMLTFSLLTLTFGVLFTYALVDGDLRMLAPNNSLGRYITFGGTLALAAAAIGVGVISPTASKIVKLIDVMQQSPQQEPPSELLGIQKRMSVWTGVSFGLLLLVLVFMVAAAEL